MNHAMFEAHIAQAKRDLKRGKRDQYMPDAEDAIFDCLEEIIAALEAAHQ